MSLFAAPGIPDKIVLNPGMLHILMKLTKNITSDNLEHRIWSGAAHYTQDLKKVRLPLCFNGNDEIINMKLLGIRIIIYILLCEEIQENYLKLTFKKNCEVFTPFIQRISSGTYVPGFPGNGKKSWGKIVPKMVRDPRTETLSHK